MVLFLLITATVIVGKDFSDGCKDFKTPKCGEDDEYRNRMWSNRSFIGLLIAYNFLSRKNIFD